MLNIPLETLPNQSLSIQLDDIRYGIRLRTIGDMTAVDISIDDNEILTGHRVIEGYPLIPYKYLENDGGNFMFLTNNGDLVYWEEFGITQTLVYFSIEELETIRDN